MFDLEKYVFIFVNNFFDLENFYFCVDFFLCQSEISPGIQKSYLEYRASILKVRKINIPHFWSLFVQILYTFTWRYPKLYYSTNYKSY